MTIIQKDEIHLRTIVCLSRHVVRLSVFLMVLLPMCVLLSVANASESVPDDAMDCLIEPWVLSDVGSQVQGVISRLLVDRGERVKRGQPLVQLKSGVEDLEVALARARADSDSELKAREAELKLAELELSRLEDLYRQNMLPAQQRDESTARVEIASAALTQALESQKIHRLELTRAQHHAAMRILTSPLDGVVLEQLAFAGEFVYDNPVMKIVALDPLRVEVRLPARMFGTIAAGDKAHVYPETGSDGTLLSAVDVVDATLDSRSGTFGVRLKVANPDFKIPAGQRCRIMFGPSVAAAQPE